MKVKRNKKENKMVRIFTRPIGVNEIEVFISDEKAISGLVANGYEIVDLQEVK